MSVPRVIRVLCVDDNRDVADSTAQYLGLCGYEAAACYDGQTALHRAAEFRPGVCIIDLNMPGMDGDELAVRIREDLPGCEIVFVAMTAMSSEDAVARTRRAGFVAHLVKPIDPGQLLSALAGLDGSNA